MPLGQTSSNLPTIQRFDAGDYPKSSKEFQQFLSTLNLFTQPVYNILNGAVDLTQNTKEEIYTFTITAGASYSNNTFVFIPRKFAGKPNGIQIGQVLVSASTVTPVGAACTLDWVWTGSQVSIIAIYGLTNGTTYSITVRLF